MTFKSDEDFIKDYGQCIAAVSEKQLRKFLNKVNTNKSDSDYEEDNHIMDCHLLWNAARAPVIKDLQAALSYIQEFSDNEFLITDEHEYNIAEKWSDYGMPPIVEDPKDYDWNEAPMICTIDGYRWLLGPESDKDMNFTDAMSWCKNCNAQLPPREILLMAYLNSDICEEFSTKRGYWSSSDTQSDNLKWTLTFSNGNQFVHDIKYDFHVRAVRIAGRSYGN